MTRRARVWILLAALPAFIAASQSRPNFNGRWVAIEPAKVAGHELVIVQDGSTLVSFVPGERLVVEQLQPPLSLDPDRASETILDVRRIVYERR